VTFQTKNAYLTMSNRLHAYYVYCNKTTSAPL